MSYQVLARKWRPQKFEDVVGQETVTRTLQNAIRSERIAHAFLFSGVRGVGKTTTARILAKALNCEKGPTPDPCNECVSCREIAASASVDVQEIDAASNTGVDNIRELRESTRYGTARDRFKIFIIDEVHMLSNAAFNALLKTLEEPPAHVKFIMATTEHQKIPVTITSRCQQFDFRPISFETLLERMGHIAREEGIQITDFGLCALVTASQGSMRDAQSALDQVIAFAGKEVADEDVRIVLGIVDESSLTEVLEALGAQDEERLLRAFELVAERGVDPQNFCQRLIQRVRDLLVFKVAGWDPHLLHLPEVLKESLVALGERFSQIDLIRFFDLLTRTESEIRRSPHPYVHLEMTLVKAIELARLPRLEEVISKLESGKPGAGSSGPKATPPSPSGASSRKARPAAPSGRAQSSAPESEAGAAEPAEGPRGPEKGDPDTDAGPAHPAARLLEKVHEEGPRLAHALEHALTVDFEDGRLRIVFPARESFHANVAREAEHLKRLGRLSEELVGRALQVDISIEEGQPDETEENPVDDPKVQAFIKAFPGKIIVDKKGED